MLPLNLANILYLWSYSMLNAMKRFLQDDLGISEERIKVEEFIGY
jgi:hypothetical protein